MRHVKNASLAWVFVLCAAAAYAADEKSSVEGTLTIGGRTYKLSRIVAYERKVDDADTVTIVASDRSLPVAQIAKALAAAEEGGDDGVSLTQPYIKIRFRTSGKIEHCQGWADNAFFSTFGSDLTGEFKVADGRAVGQATMPTKGEGKLVRACDLKFAVPIGLGAAQPKSAVAVAKPTVTGKFTGNGKPARLAFVSAHRREPFDDKPAIQLIFTEKDHAKVNRPEIDAGFGKFGSALIVSMTEDGTIFGCEVAHAAHEKKPFSTIGSLHLNDFELGERGVQGALSTDGEQDVFDQKWEADLKFAAPLPALPGKNSSAAGTSAPAKKAPPNSAANMPAGKSPAKKPGSSKGAKGDEPAPAAGPAVNVHDLPMAADATGVEYKALVQQLVYQSATKVQPLSADLTKRLAAQGWKSDGSDLVTTKSVILKRARGEATLTLMIKAEGAATKVIVFSTGLDWEEK